MTSQKVKETAVDVASLVAIAALTCLYGFIAGWLKEMDKPILSAIFTLVTIANLGLFSFVTIKLYPLFPEEDQAESDAPHS